MIWEAAKCVISSMRAPRCVSENSGARFFGEIQIGAIQIVPPDHRGDSDRHRNE
jgi:hypothetical protein